MTPTACTRSSVTWRWASRVLYRDAYYDHPGRDLAASGRELRLRSIESGGSRRALLTFKEAAVDAVSGSKPEHESQVSDPAAVGVLLTALGLEVVVEFEKHCTNYRFRSRGTRPADHRRDRA